MRKKAEDRRVRRSKKLLQEALISLLLERGYESVTIQDIAERADVGRSTFYMHFTSKDELLLSNFDELEEAVTKQQRTWRATSAERGKASFGFSLPLLQHIYGHRQIYRAIVGRSSGEAVERRVRGLVTTLVQQDMGALRRPTGKPAVPPDAVVTFVVGAFLSLVFWWLDHDAQLPPEAVDGVFHRLAAPGVEAALVRQPAR